MSPLAEKNVVTCLQVPRAQPSGGPSGTRACACQSAVISMWTASLVCVLQSEWIFTRFNWTELISVTACLLIPDAASQWGQHQWAQGHAAGEETADLRRCWQGMSEILMPHLCPVIGDEICPLVAEQNVLGLWVCHFAGDSDSLASLCAAYHFNTHTLCQAWICLSVGSSLGTDHLSFPAVGCLRKSVSQTSPLVLVSQWPLGYRRLQLLSFWLIISTYLICHQI